MVIEAISCIAVRWVTMACCLAISPAPSASVTCMTTGSATGTEAMRMARQSVRMSIVCSPRWSSTRKTATRKRTATAMTSSQTSMMERSKTLWVGLVDCCMRSVAEPISVKMPVRWTRRYEFPETTMHPERTRLFPLLSGYLRGNGSPVSAAVSTAIGSPSSQSTSAGTESPPRRKMMSPGTRVAVGSLINSPFRFTAVIGESADLMPSTFISASYSS
mmetsp:Transcript_7920/g.24311  ORF Transcript_7920/g.24311 Transcript_7920/m.24311 type:complete len:218 (+) Transcript_7920:2223-2876(+)